MNKNNPLLIIKLALVIAVISPLVFLHFIPKDTRDDVGLGVFGIAFYVAFSGVVQGLVNFGKYRDKESLWSVLLGLIVILVPFIVIGWAVWQFSYMHF